MIIDRFSPERPVSVAQGRNGDLIVTQGNGVRPLRITSSTSSDDAGMDAPSSAPSISVDETDNYYIARCDVAKTGAVYYSPPRVSFSPSPRQVEGAREAVAKSYLSQGSVSEIQVEKGGKYYPSPPNIKLTDSHGKNGKIRAVLDIPEFFVEDEANNRETGLTAYERVSEGPPWADESAMPDDGFRTIYGIWPYVDLDLSRNGIRTATAESRFFTATNTCGGALPFSYRIQFRTEYEVSGHVSGTGAVARVFGGGFSFNGVSINCSANSAFFNFTSPFFMDSATAKNFGRDYDSDATIYIRIPAYSIFDDEDNRADLYTFGLSGGGKFGSNRKHWEKAIVLRAYIGSDPENPGSGRYAIRELVIDDPGEGYVIAPALKIVSESGFGAYGTCKVSDGKISEVTLENGGGGYKVSPKVQILSGEAEGFAVARPHLRGLYQCYYRYIDDTPESRGGPVPSNLSDVVEVDVGEAATSLTWSVEPPSGRAKKVELWRSTGNQALTVYRVATIDGLEPYLDDLTDEELRDPDRDGYEAMPIMLPNGELNSQRFVPPPSDKEVVVRFQDRYWYGVGGDNPAAIYFSEIDEPESVPDVNEIVVQQNSRGFDKLTAMIPFGSTLLLMQTQHAYSLTFARQPLLDAQVSPVAYRGCLNQRCYDLYGGACYAMDREGVYAIDSSGGVKPLSDAIDDQFRGKIDFARTSWNFVSVDASTKTLRAFVCYRDDGVSPYPTRALCMSIESGAWWMESYPQPITACSKAKLGDGVTSCLYGAQGGLYKLNDGSTDAARGSIIRVSLINKGSGYTHPPKVSAGGGVGAVLQATVSGDGELSAVWILSPGTGYVDGDLYISEPDRPGGTRAVATFEATSLERDTPISPTFRYRSGFFELPSDATDRNGGSEQSRSISLSYKPLKASSEISLRTYFNGSDSPRPNLVERDRGNGFYHSVVDPAARLDIGSPEEDYFADSGVAVASYAGKTMDDMRGSDRHIGIGLVGAKRSDEDVVLYDIDVYGADRK